ncbi:MAG: diacylglycerol kinase family lipid kinase [Eubacteriales bacterium]
MHHYFIINPKAGKRDSSAGILGQIEAVFENRPQDTYAVALTQYAGHATELARDFCLEGRPGRIYGCGGDGTLHEVVAGCAGFHHVAVTVLSAGTGNDFIKSFSDPAAFSSLKNLIDGEETALDIISCGEHVANNICSVGLDARIGTDVARFKRLPLVGGFGAYILSTIYHVCRGVHAPYTYQIDDQSPIYGNQTLICIANGRWYGGGFNPVPQAELNDGLLDVLVIAPVSRLTVAKVVGKFAKGQFRDLPNLVTHYRCKSITVTSPEETIFNLDGEAVLGTTATFAVMPKALRFVHPVGATQGLLFEKEVPTAVGGGFGVANHRQI